MTAMAQDNDVAELARTAHAAALAENPYNPTRAIGRAVAAVCEARSDLTASAALQFVQRAIRGDA